MKTVSDKFKSAIIAPSRMCKMRVTFDISDTTANGDISNVITTSELFLSNKNQMFNKERDASYKLATFEKDRWLLDGTFVVPGDNNGEVGWWSKDLSNEEGVFTPNQVIEIDFNHPHSSMGITITFDTINNEYAPDFDIVAYDVNNGIINTFNITNNTLTRVAIEGQMAHYTKMVIIIKKWCKPIHRAKVMEVDFGVVRIYDDEKLIKASLIEEVDLMSANIPTDEIKFTVHNENNEFNILNPKGFYAFLQQKQQVICELGTDIGTGFEYCRMGTYWLKTWVNDEGALTTTFTARDIIDMLDNDTYENLISKDTNLKEVALAILNAAQITEYNVDESLASISTTGIIKSTTCRNALQMVAIAGMCNVYVVDNTLYIVKSNIDLSSSVGEIDMDNMYETPSVELDNAIKRVDVTYYPDSENEYTTTCENSTGGEILEVKDNTLICNEVMAKNVGNWIIALKNYRVIYNAKWRQNPALDFLDVVDIDNSYETKKAVITKQEYDYQGYLRGKTTLRGVISGMD